MRFKKKEWGFIGIWGVTGMALLTAIGLFGMGEKEKGDFQGERPAAVAGLFYPKNPGELEKDVRKYLDRAGKKSIGAVRGLVCPHAGYRYSGCVAGEGYKQLEGQDVEKVVVMAPSHYALFEGVSMAGVKGYRTPLGVMELSETAGELAKSKPFQIDPVCRVQRPGWYLQADFKVSRETPDTWEHSLEVQLPFLQVMFPKAKLIPMVFGDVSSKKVAEILNGIVDDKTVVVASSDLSHFYPYDEAVKRDRKCIDTIMSMDASAIVGEEACGRYPIQALMMLAKMRGWKPVFLDYKNSGDTAGDKSSVVGYGAIAFVEGGEKGGDVADSQGAYSDEERKYLLELARTTIEAVTAGKAKPNPNAKDVPGNLRAKRGCFVTLTQKGQLRGCIGHVFAQEALYLAIIDNAMSAAMADPRFPSVTKEEVGGLHIEISVLSELQKLKFNSPEEMLNQLRPGIDGVVLTIRGRKSTFLPQVWEHFQDKESFMSQLALKGGSWADAWKEKGVSVSVYQAEVFEERDYR